MNLDLALQTFLEESRELLADMERILLELEAAPEDTELYNALFRCVHTIKGSAGMFGLHHVVEFTHVVENVLDRLRLREIALSCALTNVLLQCRDHISLLVEMPKLADKQLQNEGDALLDGLCVLRTGAVNDAPVAGNRVKLDAWHISLRFNQDLLRHGFDPLGFIHYLGKLGQIKSAVTITDALPALAQMDAKNCYLGFEVDLFTQAGQSEIEQVFESVEGLCQLRILPPRSDLNAYLELLQQLPEEPQRLGEILTASGAMTPAELNACLALQSDQQTLVLQATGTIELIIAAHEPIPWPKPVPMKVVFT